MTLQFNGKQELIRRIDAVVDGECAKTTTQCIRDVLCDLIRSICSTCLNASTNVRRIITRAA